ncbi:MAG: tRNA pseudouridine(38-40) synthase TruA [Oscillospiraceae bacterium]|nr:tRNA pseudouridine(38-40) synthase TruA [Oscillospiraceae bacterium]
MKFIISFNGAKYHGFQSQPTAKTIQGEIENALHKLTGETVRITGCSRTDAGVHAREFCFNVNLKSTIPAEKFPKALNSQLPTDIAVHSCVNADEHFNARFTAKSKQYIYLTNNRPERDVFLQGLAYHYPYKLDINLMQKAAEKFVGEHDFAAFCRSEGKKLVSSTIREIYSFDIEKSDDMMIRFIVTGTGFLYNMVRILAGTLIYVSEGKLTLCDIDEALKTGDRNKAGKTLPPCGLYLNKVNY